jgi:hypothetical protein
MLTEEDEDVMEEAEEKRMLVEEDVREVGEEEFIREIEIIQQEGQRQRESLMTIVQISTPRGYT